MIRMKKSVYLKAIFSRSVIQYKNELYCLKKIGKNGIFSICMSFFAKNPMYGPGWDHMDEKTVQKSG